MKIAERIQLALKLKPEIARNRAKLRSIYYLHKHHPKKYKIRIFGGYASTEISLIEDDQWGGHEILNVNMLPLSTAMPETPQLQELADKGISGIMGVTLGAVKKVLDSLKESVTIPPCQNIAS